MKTLSKLAVVALAAASVTSAFAGEKLVRIEHGRDGSYAFEPSKKTATVAAYKGDRAVGHNAASRASSSRDEEVVIDLGRGERIISTVRR